MQIELKDIAKKYKNHWIFKHITYTFEQGEKYAILGENGSGKSTLLKVISGQTSVNRGEIIYNKGQLSIEDLPRNLSYCAPYIDVIEELSFRELMNYVAKYKAFSTSFSLAHLEEKFHFHENKWIKDYSSGMKQRVKLILALYLDVELILLDEPTSNLDEDGVNWFLETLEKETKNKTVIIASNIAREYALCNKIIEIKNYK